METRIETEGIIEYVKKWYGTIIPTFGTLAFIKFVTQSHMLAEATMGTTRMGISRNVNPYFSISVNTNGKATSINLDNKLISLPGFYYVQRSLDELVHASTMGIASYLSLALTNGSVYHEGLHVAHSPTNIIGLLKERHGKVIEDYGYDILFMAYNIIEDLYIESQAKSHARTFIQMKNSLLLNVIDFIEAMSDLKEDKMDDATSIIKLMAFLKNLDLRNRDEWNKFPRLAEAVKLTMKGAAYADDFNRMCAAAALVSLFPKPDSPNSEMAYNKMHSCGDGENLKAEAEVSVSEAKAAQAASKVSGSERKFIREISRSMEASSKRIDSELSEFEERAKKLQLVDIAKRYSTYYTHYHRSDKSASGKMDLLAMQIRRLRTVNHAPGSPRVRGRLVNTRLSRITTDGKICAQSDGQRFQQRVEVIVLNDWSGSTHCGVNGTGKKLNELTSEACKELHVALRKAGIPNSVYLHTGVFGDSEIPLVVHIASYQMFVNNTDWRQRFELIRYINLNQNYDGFAIEAVSRRFTRRITKKVLIILSDGVPAGDWYGGTAAEIHTMKVVTEARKNGIAVICLSLTRDIMEANNKIYGEKWNIDASSNLEAESQKVITNVVTNQGG